MLHLLKRLFRRPAPTATPRPQHHRLRLEALEDRTVPANILFFGNSYTINTGIPAARVDELVWQIAVAAGQTAPFINARAPGGSTLLDHAAAMTPAGVTTMVPPGQGVDVVVMQGQSLEAASGVVGTSGVAGFRQGATLLAADVRAAYPNARFVLYETWARTGLDPSPDVYPFPYASGPDQMQADIRAGYNAALGDLRFGYGRLAADVAPAGDAFQLLSFANGLYAGGDIGLPDPGGHPNARGGLLAAMTIYSTIYDDNVSDIGWDRVAGLLQARGLTGPDWSLLAGAADRAVGNYNFARNQQFVLQIYRDLLGREADGVGLNYWLTGLTTGAFTRAQVVQGITNSNEYWVRNIRLSYQYFLGRLPEAAGLNFFYNQLAAGASIEWPKAQILASNEYFARVGNTQAAFVTSLFNSILGRSGSAADVSYWVNQMNLGVSRLNVAVAFINSAEHRGRQVRDFYQGLLLRPADPAGLNYFIGLFNAGVRFQDVAGLFLSSGEYFRRF